MWLLPIFINLFGYIQIGATGYEVAEVSTVQVGDVVGIDNPRTVTSISHVGYLTFAYSDSTSAQFPNEDELRYVKRDD